MKLPTAPCLALIFLFPAGCARREAPLSDALKRAVASAKFDGPCSSLISMEWPPSWPVPAADGSGRRFKIFFYPLLGTQPKVHAPLGEAEVGTDDGKVLGCRKLQAPLQELPGARWPDALRGLTVSEFDRRADRLFAATEAVGALYAAKAGLTPEQTRAAGAYGRLFLEMAEPSLLPHYRRLNPDFWRWLAAAGAPSIPDAP
ncbi:MAG: hypothetical protein A2X36_08265 [Elusimicrobia bacterium GWA2_69_24]|nr:MAG: hypothetical protein A2X36_08265 [Elusimicrobia bacterium GWA2_69_24]HBL18170.1 hypothetical protein [Elusimicrobiota bacterium]